MTTFHPKVQFSSGLAASKNGSAITEWSRYIAIAAIAVTVLFIADSGRKEFAENERRQASVQTRFLLSLADTKTGVFDVRASSNQIYSASDVACKILGYEKGELDGMDISSILPMSFKELHQQKMATAMADTLTNTRPQSVSVMKCKALTKSGEEIDVIIRVFVSKNGIIALMNRFEEVHVYLMP